MADPQITAYFHCSKCLAELPSDKSPQDFADLSVGYTAEGLQVWCNRHRANVYHLDLRPTSGNKLRALVDLEGRFED